VVAHLLGDDVPDPSLAGLLDDVAPYEMALTGQLARALSSGVRLVHLREKVSGTGAAIAVAALSASGRAPLVLDLARVVSGPDTPSLLAVALREALLRSGGLVAGPVELLAEQSPEAIHLLARADVPVLLVGTATWDPQWSANSPLLVDAPVLGGRDRLALWERELGAHDPALDPASLAVHLALGPAQVRKAVRAAEAAARLGGACSRGSPAAYEHKNRRGLNGLPGGSSRRSVGRPGPRPARTSRPGGTSRPRRHRDTVLTDWRMRRGGVGAMASRLLRGLRYRQDDVPRVAADLRLDLAPSTLRPLLISTSARPRT
jgi:hypothetical protein